MRITANINNISAISSQFPSLVHNLPNSQAGRVVNFRDNINVMLTVFSIVNHSTPLKDQRQITHIIRPTLDPNPQGFG